MKLTITNPNTGRQDIVKQNLIATVLLDNTTSVKYHVGSFGVCLTTMGGTDLGGFEDDVEVSGVLILVESI